jgi:hypothetical protein
MKKQFIVMVLIIGTVSASWASPCYTEARARSAALAIEAISTGGGAPLTTEIYSLNSAPNTWAAVLSYSGVQRIYSVRTSRDGCQILQVSLRPTRSRVY